MGCCFMAIDASLTYAAARERIGRLAEPEGACAELYRDTFEYLREARRGEFRATHNPDRYDCTWAFGPGSELTKALREFYALEDQTADGSPDERVEDARRNRYKAWLNTGIPAVLGYYDLQMSAGREGLSSYDLFRVPEDFLAKGIPVAEALSNAIVHGSRFGRQGYARCRFLGGEKGALAVIQDSGEGYNLQPYSPDELQQKINRLSARLLSGRYLRDRGTGRAMFAIDEKAVIGSEYCKSGFRVLVLYPIPSDEEIAAYLQRIRESSFDLN